MKALSAQFDSNSKSMQGNRQKAQLLTQQITTEKQKILEQTRMLDESTKALGENDVKTLKWKQALAESQATLAQLENELKNVPNSLQLVGQKMQEVGSKMQSVGKNLTTHLTLPILGVATAAIKVSADFDSAMSKVAAISGATGSDLQALRDKAIEMGESTVFSATESAEALNYMAMAGWKTEDMLNGIEGVMNLAAAAGADLATTSDIVTDALTAFGQSAEESGRLADIMAAAAANSNTNIEMMGETFKYAAPIAGTLGYSMEDLAIATGLMANAGIKATNAGTALRAGLTRLAAPPKQAAQAMEDYDIQITNTDGSMKSLMEVMEIVRDRLGDLTESEQAAALKAIFGQNAISGWAAVLNASEEDFKKLSVAITNSNGAAEDMAETMRDNLAGELKLLKSELESAGITFGEVIMPYLKEGVKKLKQLVERLKNMNPEQQKALLTILAITAAAGPLLSVLGTAVKTIGTITTGIGNFVKFIPMVTGGLAAQTAATATATGAQLALNAAMYAMPAIGIVAAIVAVSTAIIKMGEAATEAKKDIDKVKDVEESIASTGSGIIDHITAFRDALREAGTESGATATQARNAADRLKELSDSGDKSESTIAGMAVAVQQLNELFPDLGLELDRSTGKLNKTGNEIEAFVQKSERMAKVETSSEKVKIGMDGIKTAAEDLTKAQYELDRAMSEQAHYQELADGIENLGQQYNDGTISLEEFKQGINDLNSSLVMLDDATIEYNGQMYNARDLAQVFKNSADALNESIVQGKDAVDGAKISLETAQSVAERYQQQEDALTAAEQANTDATNANSDSLASQATQAQITAQAFDNMTATHQAMAQEAVANMQAIEKSVTDTLGSQMDMFTQFDQKSAMSTQELLSNMQSQIDGITNWEQNLAALAEKGINQDLLQKLAQMGPDGATYVDTFNNMTTQELSKANDLWLQGLDIQGFGNDAALQLQEAIGQMTVGSEGAWQTLGNELQINAKTAGGYIGPGLIEGLQEGAGQVKTEAQNVGEDAIDGLDLGLGVESPSWKAKASGMFVDEGLAQGLTNGKSNVQGAAQGVAQVVQVNLIQKAQQLATTAQTSGLQIATRFGTGLSAGRGNVQAGIQGIVAAVQSGLGQIQAQQGAFQNAGMMLAMGMANGIAAGQSAVVNAAAALAAAAVTAAMSALQIGSPSKVADKEIGQMFGAGLVRGLDKSQAPVKASIGRLTDMMIQNPGFTPAYASGYGGGYVNNMEYGGTVINVYGAEGQDVEELAEIVSDHISANISRMERAMGA